MVEIIWASQSNRKPRFPSRASEGDALSFCRLRFSSRRVNITFNVIITRVFVITRILANALQILCLLLQPWVCQLAFQRKYAEDAFVDVAQRLMADETL